MKFKLSIYGFLLMIFAVSCNKQITELEPETSKTNQLKSEAIGTLFVSPKGSDSNSGTLSLPFLTIQKAANVAAAGDVVIVEDGTYTGSAGSFVVVLNTSGTNSAYITFKARNIGRAILDGQNFTGALGGFNVNASYINISGFQIRGMYNLGISIENGLSHLNFSDLHIHNIGRYSSQDTGGSGYYMWDSNYITIERNLIHDVGRLSPAEGGSYTSGWTGYSSLDHGIYNDGCSQLTVKNNIFYNIQSGWALQCYSGNSHAMTDLKFINNTCVNGNPHSNQPYGHIVLFGNVSNSLIANNVFKDQFGAAVGIYAGSYSYSNVTITKNSTYGGTGATTYGTASGVLIVDNFNSTDPLFSDEANHDYSLKSNSPAAITGYNTGLTTDYLNNARASINIGAFKSFSTAPASVVAPVVVPIPVVAAVVVPAPVVAPVIVPAPVVVPVPVVAPVVVPTPVVAPVVIPVPVVVPTPVAVPVPVVYYNTQVAATANKNDCGTGYKGSKVTYTIPAKKYYSSISQADANAYATNDITANSQTYANANGTCTSSTPTSLYFNIQTSATAIKNNCDSGYKGSKVTYTVMARKYYSSISQADADAYATIDINKNKQAYANANGACVPLKVTYRRKYTRRG